MTTPLIRLPLRNISDRAIYAKLEGNNPTGSLKDRMVSYILNKLEEKREIMPDTTIVEASSGNTGVALAKEATKRGYSVIVCTPQQTSPKKKELIQKMGAGLLEFDTSLDTEADIEAARKLGNLRGQYYFNQFENPYHALAYQETLGPEVCHQLQEHSISIDFLVGGVGTGASLRGLGTYLRKNHNPNLKIYAVGPAESPTRIEGLHPGHIRGHFLIWRERPRPFEDDHFLITDEEAIASYKELNQIGVFAGISSGAVFRAAMNNMSNPGNYLLLFADSAQRYSTE